MADLLFSYNIDQMVDIFEEDLGFRTALLEYGLYTPNISWGEQNPLRKKIYENLAKILLAEYDFISNRSMDDLWYLKYGVPDINAVFGRVDVVDEKLYKQIIYTFKYSTVKHFFRDNVAHFLPSMDAEIIGNSEKMNLFQMAFMQEYDKFAQVIDDIATISDIDTVSNDYLNYLVQLLGYEKGDNKLLGNDAFRELAKNIIEIYRIKGTNYSYELFFNFLGFEAKLNEFWFDKRFADSGISVNPYTGADSGADFSYYLTPHKPTEYIPENMSMKSVVLDNELTDIRSHLWWTNKLETGSSIDKLLSNNGQISEEGFDFTYFKTNIVQYEINRIRSKETDEDELTEEDSKIIQFYLDFLTPIFITKQVLISVTPFEDTIDNLKMTDATYYDYTAKTFRNMWQANSELFLVDDWIKHPVIDENRLALNILEEVDVETNKDNEEPREYFLFIKTHDYNSTVSDLLKDIQDGDSENTFGDGDLFQVSIIKEHKTEDRDENSVSSDGMLISILEYNYAEYIFTDWTVDLFPLGDTKTTIEKVMDFQEVIFNRTSRIEKLDIFNIDWVEWDDFQEVRNLPSFLDAISDNMSINSFKTNDISGLLEETFDDDDSAATTPWWYYDNFYTIKETILIMSGDFRVSGEIDMSLVLVRDLEVNMTFGASEDTLILDISPVAFGNLYFSANNTIVGNYSVNSIMSIINFTGVADTSFTEL